MTLYSPEAWRAKKYKIFNKCQPSGPEPQAAVLGRAHAEPGLLPPVLLELHAVDPVLVPLQDVGELPGLPGLPDPQRAILGGGDQVLPARVEDHAEHHVRVPLELPPELPAVVGLPDLDHLGWRFASKKIFKAKIFLRHYKVIALALGAPARGPRDARTVGHYKVIGRILHVVPSL